MRTRQPLTDAEYATGCRRLLVLFLSTFLAFSIAVVAEHASQLILTDTKTASQTSEELQLSALVNDLRQSYHLPVLRISDSLTTVARNWSAQQKSLYDGSCSGEGNGFSHNPNTASQIPPGWMMWGENVGCASTVQDMHNFFVHSPPHFSNMVGDYTEMGIGIGYGDSGILYFTEVFATYASNSNPSPVEPPAGTPQPAPTTTTTQPSNPLFPGVDPVADSTTSTTSTTVPGEQITTGNGTDGANGGDGVRGAGGTNGTSFGPAVVIINTNTNS